MNHIDEQALQLEMENRDNAYCDQQFKWSSAEAHRIDKINHTLRKQVEIKGGTFFGRFVYNGPGHGILNQSRPVTYQNGFL